MKLLWLAIPLVFLVLWWMRRSSNQRAKSRP
jgi:lipopolysaccharide biosynthesis regulator YciM